MLRRKKKGPIALLVFLGCSLSGICLGWNIQWNTVCVF